MFRTLILIFTFIPCLSFASPNLIDNCDGSLTYEVTLPSGQAYVEIFARQNGIQNIATNISNSEVDHGDGTSTYSYTAGGYTKGDTVEYRFYSYLPASPGVFTPKLTQDTNEVVWVGDTVSVLKTTIGEFDFCANDSSKLTYVYKHSDLSQTFPQQTGWVLYRAEPEDLDVSVDPSYTNATFKGIFVKPCFSDVWVDIQDTPYAYPTGSGLVYENFYQGEYDYMIFASSYAQPAGRPSGVYACGGEVRPILTFIGYQDVRTNAEVRFAYVVEFTQP